MSTSRFIVSSNEININILCILLAYHVMFSYLEKKSTKMQKVEKLPKQI